MSFFEIAMIAGIMILFAFAIQLFALSKGNFLLNRLLGFVFLSRGVQSLLFLFISLSDHSSFSFITSVMPVIIFLGPPAFYLYIRSFVYDKT